MRNLLNFLIKYNGTVLFLILELVSLTLLVRGNNYQSSVYFTSAGRMTGAVCDVWHEVTGYFGLRSVNSALTSRNAELMMENERLKSYISEHDSTMLDEISVHENIEGYKLISARVVNNSVSKLNNLITIDKGLTDGVKEEAGVVSGTGVVGIVYIAGDHHSIVLPVLNPNSSISCKIKRTSYFGFLKWDGGAVDYAILEDMPRHSEFTLGDTIVTSGHSAVFPEGVPVGTVDDMKDSDDGLSYLLRIKLFTDFARLNDVVVIDDQNREQQKALAEKVRLN